jgi:hypothetical protein
MFDRTVKFYREPNGSWYVDLPEWTGPKSDLQMVLGADNLLEMISEGEAETMVRFSTESFDGADVLNFMHEGIPGDIFMGGGMYKLENYKGIKQYGFQLWLCDVTKFVFGNMPEKIYFR